MSMKYNYIIKNGIRYLLTPVPGFTTSGDISIGANKLKTTNLLLKENNVNEFAIRDITDANYKSLHLYDLTVEDVINMASTTILRASSADNTYFTIYAKQTGGSQVEVARVQGAAIPYLQATLGLVLKPNTQALSPLVQGLIIYNSATNLLNFYDGAAWHVVTSV